MLLHLRWILPHEVLADAGGTAAEISEFWHPASGISYLPLLSHNNNTMPLRVFTRRHYNVLEAGGMICGGWRVVGYPPKYVFVLYAYYVLIAYYTVWDVSEVRMTHPC